MFALSPQNAEPSDAWIEEEEGARWRSSFGHGPDSGASASGSSLLEVLPGCRLPRHADSAEETIVVVEGTAEVWLDGESAEVPAGGVALIPAGRTHEVRNVSEERPLRFVAVYADTDVVTTYERYVQPDGERERQTVG